MDTKTPPAAWHIPRPSLSSAASGRGREGSASSQGSTSSHSTQSARSGSVLLNSARLPHMIIPEHDTSWSHVTRGASEGLAPSVASSTHFTLVNGYTKQPSTETAGCCARSHHITVLVLTMTVLLSAAILAAICFVEMRMRNETGVYKYS